MNRDRVYHPRLSAQADFDHAVRARTTCYKYTCEQSRSGLISPRTCEICDRKNLASGSVSSGEPSRSSRLRSESIALACPAGSFMLGGTPFTSHYPSNLPFRSRNLRMHSLRMQLMPSGSRSSISRPTLIKSEGDRHLRHPRRAERRDHHRHSSVFPQTRPSSACKVIAARTPGFFKTSSQATIPRSLPDAIR